MADEKEKKEEFEDLDPKKDPKGGFMPADSELGGKAGGGSRRRGPDGVTEPE